jgi:hypothetical protein
LAAILLTSVDDEVLYLKIGDEQQQFALKMAARISNAIALGLRVSYGQIIHYTAQQHHDNP